MCVVAEGDHRCLRGSAAVTADAVRRDARGKSRAGVVRRSKHDDRRLSAGLRAVRRRAHPRLLQRALLVPCHLHSLRAVHGSRPLQRGSQLRHAGGQTSTSTAAATQPPPGVSTTPGDDYHCRLISITSFKRTTKTTMG